MKLAIHLVGFLKSELHIKSKFRYYERGRPLGNFRKFGDTSTEGLWYELEEPAMLAVSKEDTEPPSD